MISARFPDGHGALFPYTALEHFAFKMPSWLWALFASYLKTSHALRLPRRLQNGIWTLLKKRHRNNCLYRLRKRVGEHPHQEENHGPQEN